MVPRAARTLARLHRVPGGIEIDAGHHRAFEENGLDGPVGGLDEIEDLISWRLA
jgi:hypothetical protein